MMLWKCKKCWISCTGGYYYEVEGATSWAMKVAPVRMAAEAEEFEVPKGSELECLDRVDSDLVLTTTCDIPSDMTRSALRW